MKKSATDDSKLNKADGRRKKKASVIMNYPSSLKVSDSRSSLSGISTDGVRESPSLRVSGGGSLLSPSGINARDVKSLQS